MQVYVPEQFSFRVINQTLEQLNEKKLDYVEEKLVGWLPIDAGIKQGLAPHNRSMY